MGKYDMYNNNGNYDLFTRIMLGILYLTCCSLTVSWEIFKVLFIFMIISLGVCGVIILFIVIGSMLK
jgi:hypothetical protein